MSNKLVKVAVISDTHLMSFRDLPQILISRLKPADIILHAGDLGSVDLLNGLKTLGPQVYAVCGNMDPPELRRILPDQQLITVNQLRIGLFHGRGAPINLINTVKERFANDKVDCIVYGHSHCPFNQTQQGVLFFNPGSPTDKFFAPFNSYGLLEIRNTIKAKIIKL
ncbi:metallophosphoesterase family protein [Candidatus Omnitrophota bacterium]